MNPTGDEYFDSAEFRDLLAEYEQAIGSGAPVFLDADELAEIADYYQVTGRTDEADEAISLALERSPGATMPLTYKIHEALAMGDPEAAEGYLAQMIERDEPEYTYNRAEIMVAKGEIDEADNFLRENFKTVPPDEYQDYVLDVASIFSDYGYGEKAMAWLSKAKPEDTNDFKELMARTLFGLGKFKDSEKLFNELIDRDPFSKNYWNMLASAQFMSEDYNAAVTSSEYAIAIDPNDPEALMAKANGLYRLDNYEQALDYYRRYTQQVPDDEFSLLNQGACLVNLNRMDEAEQVLQEAISVGGKSSPYLVDIYQELAFVHSEKGEVDKALDFLNATDHLDCDHIQLNVVKGHVLLAGGRLEEAERLFRKAINDSPSPQLTLLRVIVSLYDNRYLTAAYTLFKKFFTLVDDDWNDGYAYMALCCWDMKKYDEFLSYLKEACNRNTQEVRMVLGHLFPEDVEPKDYYSYIKEKLSQQ